MSDIIPHFTKELLDITNSSFGLLRNTFSFIFDRSDYYSTVKNSNLIPTEEDKLKVSQVIDELIENEQKEKEIELSNGNKIKICI